MDDSVAAAQLYQEALALEKVKDYPAAVGKMRDAIDRAPDNDLYLAYAGHLERLAGDYAAGVTHALQAVRLHENKAAWYYAAVAFAAHGKGDRELARTYCKKVLNFLPQVVGQANHDLARKLLAELEQQC